MFLRRISCPSAELRDRSLITTWGVGKLYLSQYIVTTCCNQIKKEPQGDLHFLHVMRLTNMRAVLDQLRLFMAFNKQLCKSNWTRECGKVFDSPLPESRENQRSISEMGTADQFFPVILVRFLELAFLKPALIIQINSFY